VEGGSYEMGFAAQLSLDNTHFPARQHESLGLKNVFSRYDNLCLQRLIHISQLVINLLHICRVPIIHLVQYGMRTSSTKPAKGSGFHKAAPQTRVGILSGQRQLPFLLMETDTFVSWLLPTLRWSARGTT
jgi:hypothetical protein